MSTRGKWCAMQRFALVPFLASIALGCYTLQPIRTTSPILGSEIGLDLNDAGRVALGGTMGPEIGQIEGRLVRMDSSGYLLSVSTVHFLRGGEQVWTGERVSVKTDYVSSVTERKLSKGRTAILSAAGIAAVAIIVTRAIVVSGRSNPDVVPVDTAQTIRIPWP